MNRRRFLLSAGATLAGAPVVVAEPDRGAYWLPAVEEARRRLAEKPPGGFVLEFFENAGRSYAVQRNADGATWCLWECQGNSVLILRHTVRQP